MWCFQFEFFGLNASFFHLEIDIRTTIFFMQYCLIHGPRNEFSKFHHNLSIDPNMVSLIIAALIKTPVKYRLRFTKISITKLFIFQLF